MRIRVLIASLPVQFRAVCNALAASVRPVSDSSKCCLPGIEPVPFLPVAHESPQDLSFLQMDTHVLRGVDGQENRFLSREGLREAWSSTHDAATRSSPRVLPVAVRRGHDAVVTASSESSEPKLEQIATNEHRPWLSFLQLGSSSSARARGAAGLDAGSSARSRNGAKVSAGSKLGSRVANTALISLGYALEAADDAASWSETMRAGYPNVGAFFLATALLLCVIIGFNVCWADVERLAVRKS
eukprot:TRINITY_DN17591_c0_g1_i1.p1 TRINITY_DN17591_c0_g1~~TRINITY_DN17591_c0_g1_i1.p1  ORF type:complete len:243 (+),score=28.00 TRINITY_DN17591_c0_g1_i1:78-806(+)